MPLSLLSFHPFLSYTGSAHNKSHSNPTGGISVGLFIDYIFLILFKSGPIPPCIHRILSSINADIGIQLNTSTNIFHILISYRLLHSSKKP